MWAATGQGVLKLRIPIWPNTYSGVLRDAAIPVTCKEQLPVLDEIMAELTHEMIDAEPLPDVLDGDGVTVDRVRRFASGCRDLLSHPAVATLHR